MRRVKYVCIILHNMIVEDNGRNICDADDFYEPSNIGQHRSFDERVSDRIRINAEMKHKETHHSLRHDLDDAVHDVISDEKNRRRLLDEDERDKSLDVGPNGRPLFTSAGSLSELNRKDVCSYIQFRKKLEEVLPERLPSGMGKEFDESMRDALLVRHSFLDLRDNF